MTQSIASAALLIRTLLVAGFLSVGMPVMAQDSFGDAPQASRKTQQAPQSRNALPEPATKSTPPPAHKTAVEAQDFGVAPSPNLRPTNQLHGPTPTSIPGGKVVGTQQLAAWMQGQNSQEGRVMLLHAIGSQEHLPHAIPVVPASQGGGFNDQTQRDFGQYLKQATRGDRGRLIVTYCAGVQCWGSYNAALRAIHLGYQNVYWYRGGMDAWRAAGLPLRSGN